MNFYFTKKYFIVIYCCCAFTGCASDKLFEVTKESKEASLIWHDKFYGKPRPERLDDSRLLTEMTLLSAVGKGTPGPRGTIVADLMMPYSGTSGFKEPLEDRDYFMRAELLKGAPLDVTERENIKSFSSRQQRQYFSSHSNAFRFGMTLSGSAGNLIGTVGDCKNMGKALEAIAKQHGWCSEFREEQKPSLVMIKESLRRKIPPVLICNDGKWLICCGCYEDNGQTYLMINDPENTTLTKFKVSHGNLEEKYLNANAINNAIRNQIFIYTDMKLSTIKEIPSVGFEFRPYKEGQYVACWFVNGWRKSAEHWDSELCDLLNIPIPLKKETVLPKGTPTDGNLWDYYFFCRPQLPEDPCGIVPVKPVPAELGLNPFCAAFVASAFSQNKSIGEFALTPSKLYRRTCELYNSESLYLTEIKCNHTGWAFGEELEKLKAFSSTLADRYLAIWPLPPPNEVDKYLSHSRYDPPEPPEEHRQRLVSVPLKSPQAEARLLSLMGDEKDDIPALLDRLERICGWGAVYETSADPSFEELQAAIQRGIPVLLQSKKDPVSWTICAGYLVHENKPLLLLFDPLKGAAKGESLDSHSPFPATAASFEPFERGRYTAHFVHHWKESARPYADELKKAFANNPWLPGKEKGVVPGK